MIQKMAKYKTKKVFTIKAKRGLPICSSMMDVHEVNYEALIWTPIDSVHSGNWNDYFQLMCYVLIHHEQSIGPHNRRNQKCQMIIYHRTNICYGPHYYCPSKSTVKFSIWDIQLILDTILNPDDWISITQMSSHYELKLLFTLLLL